MLRGTRLPVSAVLDNYDAGLGPEEVAELFDVGVSDVRTVLGFRESQLADPSRP